MVNGFKITLKVVSIINLTVVSYKVTHRSDKTSGGKKRCIGYGRSFTYNLGGGEPLVEVGAYPDIAPKYVEIELAQRADLDNRAARPDNLVLIGPRFRQ